MLHLVWVTKTSLRQECKEALVVGLLLDSYSLIGTKTVDGFAAIETVLISLQLHLTCSQP